MGPQKKHDLSLSFFVKWSPAAEQASDQHSGPQRPHIHAYVGIGIDTNYRF